MNTNTKKERLIYKQRFILANTNNHAVAFNLRYYDAVKKSWGGRDRKEDITTKKWIILAITTKKWLILTTTSNHVVASNLRYYEAVKGSWSGRDRKEAVH